MEMAIISTNLKGIIVSVNMHTCKLFGYSRDELLGKNCNILMPMPYKQQHDSYMERLQKTRKARVLGTSRVVEGQHKDGTSLPLRLTLSEVHTAKGSLYMAMLEKLKSREIVLSVTRDGIIAEAFGASEEVLGMSHGELIGQNISILMPEPIRQKHQDFVVQYLKSNRSNVIGKVRNFTAQSRYGERIPISLKVKRLPIVRNNIMFTASITPIEADMEAMVTTNGLGTIQSFNKSFEVMFGYSKEDILGKSISIVLVKPVEDHEPEYKRYQITPTGSPRSTPPTSESESDSDVSPVDSPLPFRNPKRLSAMPPLLMHVKHSDGSMFVARVSVDSVSIFEAGKKTRWFQMTIIRPLTLSDKLKRRQASAQKNNAKEDDFETVFGDYIGHYILGKTLGEGCFGPVKLATHRFSNEQVAIKTLRKKQFVALKMPYPPREVSLLKKLRHPNICQLYDIITLHDRILLMTEYCSGGELFDYLEELNYFPEPEARRLFRQMISAVEYMHRKGIVHRDLKLENCLLDDQRNIKIIDLGLGNFFKPHQLLESFCGTPDYAAPELWMNEPYDGPAADIWSLGVLLFSMVTGRMPFRNPAQVIEAGLRFPSTPTLSWEVKDLISIMLTASPKARASCDEIMNHAWTTDRAKLHPPPRHSDVVEINEDIIQEMEELGFPAATVTKSLTDKDSNQFTTTYFLLERRNKREMLKFSQDLEQGLHQKTKENILSSHKLPSDLPPSLQKAVSQHIAPPSGTTKGGKDRCTIH